MANFKRSISESFFNDLYHNPLSQSEEEKHESILHPFLKRVWNDDTLNLELRGNEVHIYYRGGTFLRIKEKNDNSYQIHLSNNEKEDDGKYYDNYLYAEKLDELDKKIIREYKESEEFIKCFPYMKDAMDLHFNNNKNYEREYQQMVVRDNNVFLNKSTNKKEESKKTKYTDEFIYKFSNISSNDSDYFLIDMEIALSNDSQQEDSHSGNFDLIGVNWNSDKRQSYNSQDLDLTIIELKINNNYGGKSDTNKHYLDVLKLVEDKETMNNIKEGLIKVFNQKRDLLLIHNKNYLREKSQEHNDSFSNNIDFVILLVNHKPNKKDSKENKTLISLLKELQEQHQKEAPENLNIKVATSNFMGAALQKESIYELSEFMDKFSDQISLN